VVEGEGGRQEEAADCENSHKQSQFGRKKGL